MSTARRLVLCMAGSVFLAGCADNSSPNPTAPSRSMVPTVSLDKNPGRDVTQSVDGHAAFDVLAFPGEREEYSVNAKSRANGEVFGELELKQERNGQHYKIHGTMFCLTTDGDAARMAVRVDRSNHPDVDVGQYLGWSVVDNDVTHHEKNSDLSTEFYLFDAASAQAYCRTVLFAAPFYRVKGHIEVRNETSEEKRD